MYSRLFGKYTRIVLNKSTLSRMNIRINLIVKYLRVVYIIYTGVENIIINQISEE